MGAAGVGFFKGVGVGKGVMVLFVKWIFAWVDRNYYYSMRKYF